MPPPRFRSVHVRAFSGWRALVAGGLVLAVMAVLAFLAFGLFLVLVPVAIVAGIASLLLPKVRPVSLHRARRRGGNVIEGDYKVISEEKTALDRKEASRDGEP